MKLLSLVIGNIGVTPPTGIPSNGLTDLTRILQVGVGYLLIAAALLAFLYLIWGGYKWMTSGGNQSSIDAARMQIIYALLGLLIAFAAFIIVGAVGHSIFGSNVFQ